MKFLKNDIVFSYISKGPFSIVEWVQTAALPLCCSLLWPVNVTGQHWFSTQIHLYRTPLSDTMNSGCHHFLGAMLLFLLWPPLLVLLLGAMHCHCGQFSVKLELSELELYITIASSNLWQNAKYGFSFFSYPL